MFKTVFKILPKALSKKYFKYNYSNPLHGLDKKIPTIKYII